MSGRRRAAALAAVAVLAAACAQPTHWRKPGADVDEWSRDESACRARARTLAEREFRARSSEVGSPMADRGDTLEKQMAVYDARRDERRLFEDCMRAKGYAPDKGASK